MLQDNSYTGLSMIKLHIANSHTQTNTAPIENDSNRREHVFNCHLTVMNVSDQPSMVKWRKTDRNWCTPKHCETSISLHLSFSLSLSLSIKDIRNVFVFHRNKQGKWYLIIRILPQRFFYFYSSIQFSWQSHLIRSGCIQNFGSGFYAVSLSA